MPFQHQGYNAMVSMSDQEWPPLLAQPTKSKAVPIVIPGSGKIQPVPIVQKPASTFPASLCPNTTNPNSKGTIPASSNLNDPQAAQLEKESAEGDVGQAFNIYAPPFVPEALMIINRLSGQVIDTPPAKRIHFGAYVGTYIGTDILRLFPPPIVPPSVAPDSVTHTHYELYFRYHLEAEIESQKKENALYSLYGHEITPSSNERDESICSFFVPGLREDNPHVEEDDMIQLRQLNYDNLGRGLGMEHWLARGRSAGFQSPGWTGTIYNARASVVQRKQEQLVVRVCGTIAHTNLAFNKSGRSQFKFNIQFPVPMDRYLPMFQALSIIQETFKQANANRKYIIPLTSLNSPQKFEGPSLTCRPWLRSILFPNEADCEMQTNLNPGSFKRSFFDKELNWEQKKAIESVCLQNYGTLPFLISGPPGTGKTKTLVEIALQLIKNVDKISHVLFCAPSDPAADTIVQRISVHLKHTELLRLNRPARTFAEVPGSVLPFCHISENKFDLPPFKQLMSYKLIVTTCRDASLLLYSRLTNADLYVTEYGMRRSIHPYSSQPSQMELHWTALLMDESAQATEPEALIPLSIVAPPLDCGKLAFTPLFAMAGDEHQLGPRTSLRSSPLRTSLFGRLFARPVYADHPLARGKQGTAQPAFHKGMLPIARPAFANLILNYRSHPAILAVPSALFYADTLEPKATDTDRLAEWSGWKGRGWPVLYYDNASDDDLEQDGGGWYNVGEARIACQYAAELVKTGLVEQKEVCIMSPFKAQVQCLRKTIRETQYGSLWDVDIGPTEAFQGLERAVVILCTTRSRQNYVEKDKAIDWGIIGLPNKMNVALTRAKFGLIVIGKKELLLQDPNWKAFLMFCARNGLTTGKTTSGDEPHHSSFFQLTRLEKVLLAKGEDLDDSRVIKGVHQDDEMWRHEQEPGDMNGYGFSDNEDDNDNENDNEDENEDGNNDHDEADEDNEEENKMNLERGSSGKANKLADVTTKCV